MLAEPGLPVAEHDLRDTFKPDELLGEALAPPVRPRSNSSLPEVPTRADTGGIADAAALLSDEDGVVKRPRRGKGGAEARASARRCPTCGSVVPVGMSLCNRCGLDLDTGQRTQIDELLDLEPPAPRSSGPPIGIMLVGGITFMASLIATVLALVFAGRSEESRVGYLSLALVGGFGVYAAVEFLRGRSIKLLAVALLLGAMVVGVGMIAMPFVAASQLPAAGHAGVVIDPLESEREAIQIDSLADRIEPYMNLITGGVALLLLDASALFYLTTPGVRRHFGTSR